MLKHLRHFSKMYNFQIALTISYVLRGISREILAEICHLDFNCTWCLSATRQRDQVNYIWKGISKVLSRSTLSLVTTCLKFSSNVKQQSDIREIHYHTKNKTNGGKQIEFSAESNQFEKKLKEGINEMFSNC